MWALFEAAGTSIIEVSGIGVAYKDHINRTVGDAAVWIRGNIVEELVDITSGGLGGRRFLGADGSDIKENFIVNRMSVP